MGHIQLRRYTIAENRFDEFLAWWQGLVPIRVQYGYSVLFAFADRVNNQFVWAVEHPQPLEEADPVYNSSPERAEHIKTMPKVVESLTVSEIEPIARWSAT